MNDLKASYKTVFISRNIVLCYFFALERVVISGQLRNATPSEMMEMIQIKAETLIKNVTDIENLSVKISEEGKNKKDVLYKVKIVCT